MNPSSWETNAVTSIISVGECESISALLASNWCYNIRHASSTTLYVSGLWSYIFSLFVMLFQSFYNTSGWWALSTLLCSCHFPSTEGWVNVSSSKKGEKVSSEKKKGRHPFECFSLQDIKCSLEWRHCFAAGLFFTKTTFMRSRLTGANAVLEKRGEINSESYSMWQKTESSAASLISVGWIFNHASLLITKSTKMSKTNQLLW